MRENQTIEIVCEALGWAPAPAITWMTNDSLIDKSSYVTQQGPGSLGLHNALSTLTLTPTDTEVLTCLADIEALPSPQNATVTLIFDNSAAGKWMFAVLFPCCTACTQSCAFCSGSFCFKKSFVCKSNPLGCGIQSQESQYGV